MDSSKSSTSKAKPVKAEDTDTNQAKDVNEDNGKELPEKDFNMKDGIETLITNHITLNRKVGLFNFDLSVLTTYAQTIDSAIVDIENRLRKLEGRSDYNYKTFLQDILSSANITDDLKLVSKRILALSAGLEGLKEGGSELALEHENFLNFLAGISGSDAFLEKIGFRPLEIQSMTSSQLRRKRRQKKKYDEWGRSMGATSSSERESKQSTICSQRKYSWDFDYAETVKGEKIRRIPGVTYDAFERSLNPFKCRKCGEKITSSEQLITALVQVEVNYFLNDDHPYDEDINLFTCRVCGLPVTSEDFIKKHVNGHIVNNQVCYCVKCQKEINKLEDSCDVIDEESPEFISLQTILTLDEGAFTRRRADIKFAPRCANCGRIFSYLVPLVKKIVVQSSKATPPQTDEVAKCFYVCLVCGMKKSYKSHIELHALSHIEDDELYCNNCSIEETPTDSACKDGVTDGK